MEEVKKYLTGLKNGDFDENIIDVIVDSINERESIFENLEKWYKKEIEDIDNDAIKL